MSEHKTCPDCGELLIQPAKYADPGFFEPIAYHQQGGLECVKRQNSQLRAALKTLPLAAYAEAQDRGESSHSAMDTLLEAIRAHVKTALAPATNEAAVQPEGEQP